MSAAGESERVRGAGLIAGLRYPWRGARFVYVEHRSLVRFWLPPVLITIALLAATLAVAFAQHDRLTEALWAMPTGEGWLASVQRLLHHLLQGVIGLVSIGLALLATALLSSVIAAPFNDALSAAVERLYRGGTAPPFSLAALVRDLFRTLALESLKLAAYAAVMLSLFTLSVALPGAGSLIQTVVSFGLTAIYFALDHVDYSATRHGLSVRERLGFAGRHLRAMFGFGAGVWLLLFVPLVNLLFMPAAVAGGTLLFLDLQGRASIDKTVVNIH